jgi:hypothetical protein
VASSLGSFVPPTSAVVANTLWFLSLTLSLLCALGATLVQQWARNYMRWNQRWRSLEKRGVFHVILSIGAERFGLDHASDWIVALLHLAVALFMAGLITFLFPTNTAVAWSSVGLMLLAGIAYAILSILPAIALDCPYRTPLTPISKFILPAARPVLHAVYNAGLAVFSSIFFTYFLILGLLSLRRTFRDSTSQARNMARRLVNVFVGLCEPIFSTNGNELVLDSLSLNLSRTHFAVERALHCTDDMVELEDFFDSIAPLLDNLLRNNHPNDLQPVMDLLEDSSVRILGHLFPEVLFSVISQSGGSLSPHILPRRSITAIGVASRILQENDHRQDLPCLHGSIARLCDRWDDFSSGGEPAIRLVARAHRASLGSSLYGRRTDICSTPQLVNLFDTQVIRLVHNPMSCGSCDKLERDMPRTDRPGTFVPVPHFNTCNLLTLLVDIFTTSLSAVQAESTVWLPLLDDVLRNLDDLERNDPVRIHSARQRISLEHRHDEWTQHLSPDFVCMLADAGLAAWLAPGSDFTSNPADGLPKNMEMLQRYPLLLDALRMLAIRVSLTSPVHEQQVRHLFGLAANLTDNCTAAV